MGTRRKVLWTTPALGDLAEMREWISRDSPIAARRLAKRIRATVNRLKAHPELGRVVPELAAMGYREVIVSPFRIIYSAQGSTVIVLRIWHGKRDLGD
jgi:toxin ParE1/3/4